jgi:hypothetical protein
VAVQRELFPADGEDKRPKAPRPDLPGQTYLDFGEGRR